MTIPAHAAIDTVQGRCNREEAQWAEVEVVLGLARRAARLGIHSDADEHVVVLVDRYRAARQRVDVASAGYGAAGALLLRPGTSATNGGGRALATRRTD